MVKNEFRKNNPNNKIYLGKLIDPSPSAITTIYSRGDIDWNVSSIPDSANILNITLSIYSDVDPTNSTFFTNYTLNITQITGNSYFYSDSSLSCQGNCNFYIDMGNGTVYNSTQIQTQAFVNLTLSQDAKNDLKNSLSSDIFSTGLMTNFTEAGKELWIASRDANAPARRPKLIIQHSYESYDLTYDDNGNLISGYNKKMTYDAFNKLIQMNDSNNRIMADYFYDEQGKRLMKIKYNIDVQGNNKTTYYMNWRPAEFIQTRYTNGTIINETYIYLYDKLVAMIDNDNKKFFYHPDHLGSTTLVTNESSDVVENNVYLPYGAVYSGSGTSRFLYTGQEFDAEVELYDYGARWYDPRSGHFIQCDTVKPDIFNPQALNCYSYVLNNPYKYTDESGNIPVDVVVDVVFIGIGAYQLAKDPSWGNLGALGLDVGFALVPYVPNVKRGTEIAKTLSKSDVAQDILSKVGRGADGIGNKADDIISTKLDSIGNKFDNIKGELSNSNLKGAQSELAGKPVSFKSTGEAFDHLKKVEQGQRGLLNQIKELKNMLSDTRLSNNIKQDVQERLSRSSKLLDKTERYIPRRSNRR